ncbi:MAG: TetR/AcrR family transcriptional regulator [Pseudoxanthomonas sp.]
MRPAPTPSATRRMQRVHQAVRELMSEQGFRISMEAVALRAGCSKQTLYAQFGSKQALMRSMMQDHLEQATAALDDESTDLRQALVAFAIEHLERLSDPAVLASCQLINAEARHFPEEARALFLDGPGRMIERLGARLLRAMQRGRLRHDDPHFAAELLLGMIVGSDFERQRFSVPHRDTDAARRQWAEFAVDAFLRAFAPVAALRSIHTP